MARKLEFTLESIDEAAVKFLSMYEQQRIFAFKGKMGAGKTTFITSLCKSLGAQDLVSSPTFAIVNEYETEHGETLFHFDFYRIESPSELFDIGFEEYCQTNGYMFIEWPEKAPEVLPEETIFLEISESGEGKRTISDLGS